MNTVVLWFLVTVGGLYKDQVVYSPPMPDLKTCEFVQKSVETTNNYKVHSRCIQINTVVTK